MIVESILYVEDDTSLQKIVKDLLMDSGINVVLAGSIDESLVKINNQKFDLYLLDYNLGYKNTSEVIISEIKKQNKNARIIVMSGVLDAEIISKIKEEIEHVLVKPVSAMALEAAVFKTDY